MLLTSVQLVIHTHVLLGTAEEQNIHPELKAEAEGIVAALENAGFQGPHAGSAELSKSGGKATSPFTLGRVWQSFWQAAESLGQSPPTKQMRGDGKHAGEDGEKTQMLQEAAAAKGAPSVGGMRHWGKWTPAVAWLALLIPVLYIASTTGKLSSELGSWRLGLAGCPGV